MSEHKAYMREQVRKSATHGRHLVDAYHGARGDRQAAITDLIANLLHYSKRIGLDPRRVMVAACDHCETERAEAGMRD